MKRLCKSLIYALMIGVVLAGSLSDASAEATRDEAQRQFAEEIRNRGQNPYIEHDLVRDLERRTQQIVLAPVRNNTGDEFDPRTRQILSNFEDRFDYAELMRKIRLTRQGWSAMKAQYPVFGNARDCRISPNRVRVPVWDSKTRAHSEPFTFEFVEGECNAGGVAHGTGWARSKNGGNAQFSGRFDNGRMTEGVFMVNADKGHLHLAIGTVATPDLIGRMLISNVYPNGFTHHRYGDIDHEGRLQGFGLHVWNYANYMIVRGVGDHQDDKKHGFAARMYKQKRGDSSNWSVQLGMWKDGKMNGIGAYTNGIDWIQIGEYTNGKANGVEYGQYADVDDDTHQFEVGQRVNGKREGVWQVTASNSFGTDYWTETYRNGEEIANSIQPAFTMGQIMAFSMGAAIIGAADVPSAAKLQIGTALAQDTLGGGGGSNLAALQQSFKQQASRAGATSSGSSSASQSASAGGGLTTEQVNITCAQSGVSNTIPITYRTRACFIAAKQFAETYACNKLDFQRVSTNCQRLCGHPQCLQQ